ncbi:hypothetical protein H072_6889 [Dactylellina haptotyla CBS 200.50]|uniref:Uncharacterized protein n=1 Tax=Dactylellina haptotyla (strain CBS 200.50) TaxID=1284197 RepID=S8A8D5_DACHA|nr:hypothetical protein H072_6889 [Dactylellina haptotyla CBS 200.50]
MDSNPIPVPSNIPPLKSLGADATSRGWPLQPPMVNDNPSTPTESGFPSINTIGTGVQTGMVGLTVGIIIALLVVLTIVHLLLVRNRRRAKADEEASNTPEGGNQVFITPPPPVYTVDDPVKIDAPEYKLGASEGENMKERLEKEKIMEDSSTGNRLSRTDSLSPVRSPRVLV